MFNRLFLDHLRLVGETYFEHQRNALGYAISMLTGGFACLVHSLIPGIFVTTGSRTVRELNDRMRNRSRHSPHLVQIETWDI
jgi:hypothetical protein